MGTYSFNKRSSPIQNTGKAQKARHSEPLIGYQRAWVGYKRLVTRLPDGSRTRKKLLGGL